MLNYFENKFTDVGKKIKSIAVWQAIFFTVICWICGITVMFQDESLMLWGIIIIILGTLGGSLSTIILYGFGELIDCVSNISNHINGNKSDIKKESIVVKTKKIDLNSSCDKNDDLSMKKVIVILSIIIGFILFLWLINS